MVTCCIIVKGGYWKRRERGEGLEEEGRRGRAVAKGETKRKGENLVQFKGTVS